MKPRIPPLGLTLAWLMLANAGPVLADRPHLTPPDQGKGVRSTPWQSWIDPAIPFSRAPPQRQHRIVYAFDKPGSAALTIDMELSKQCRKGRFNQLIDLQYRAFGPNERAYGVAYGRMAVNLYDPDKRRNDDTVYFFRDHDTSICRVYKAAQADLRRFYIGP